MPQLVIENLHELSLPFDAAGQSILELAQAARLDWMHACGAKGRCTTCRVEIVDGEKHLPPDTPAEVRFRSANRLQSFERLSCQLKPVADLRVRIPDACKFPHMKYSN